MVSELEKELVLRVADSSNSAAIYIYHMREVCRVAKETDFLLMLKWLKDNRLTGAKFSNWIKFEKNGDPVLAVATIRKSLLKDNQIRSVIARDNVRPS